MRVYHVYDTRQRRFTLRTTVSLLMELTLVLDALLAPPEIQC